MLSVPPIPIELRNQVPPAAQAAILSVIQQYEQRSQALGISYGKKVSSRRGQLQFRIPEGTCELYWVEVDSEGRRPDEKWQDYVARTADEVLSRFRLLRSRFDFVNEGVNHFPILRELHDHGVALDQFLCFVL